MQIVYMTGKEGYERELFDFQPLNFLAKPLNEAKVRECIAMAYGKWTVRKLNFIIGNLIRFMQSALAELFPLKLIKDIFS